MYDTKTHEYFGKTYGRHASILQDIETKKWLVTVIDWRKRKAGELSDLTHGVAKMLAKLFCKSTTKYYFDPLNGIDLAALLQKECKSIKNEAVSSYLRNN